MQLMQYEITLPADYDMDIIRQRVAARGSRTDDFTDLGAKAYLIRERNQHGSPVNQYAPFYVWAGDTGLNQFLFGPGFDGIRTDFGRPAVRTWRTVAVVNGPAPGKAPAAATRQVEPVDPRNALPDLVDRVVEDTVAAANEANVNGTVAGIDPSTWQLVRFTLWNTQPPESTPGDRYTVLHLSQPHRRSLPSGRAW
ncbi:MAG TPA: DUF4865 family protein [Nocardioides sp.]|uniref:DUF4865 family protein n=1 Tax=Nocardioides sp. TaxID=35761 RepID=UPI002B7E2D6C|nr:DUF4865 family protein [Nocardioides sp.]HQR25433.1 DUF4865 family protein [Nocardioides sp.]